MSTSFHLVCRKCLQYVDLAVRFAGGARVYPSVPGQENVPDRIGEFCADHADCYITDCCDGVDMFPDCLVVVSEHDLEMAYAHMVWDEVKKENVKP